MADSNLGMLEKFGGTVKYKILNLPSKQPALGRPEVEAIIANAFSRWEAVSNFDFDPTAGDDWLISLEFGNFENYLSPEQIAKEPDTLAFASALPNDSSRRRIVFSDRINWTKGAQVESGTMVNPLLWFITKAIQNVSVANLPAVAVHEIGHVLGLSHNDDPDSIMQPRLADANGSVLYFLRDQTLRNVDANAIQSLYGSPFVARPPRDWTKGYAIVGSTFFVGHQDSTEFQTLGATGWGQRQGESVTLMSGYCWDQVRGQRGYGDWIAYLSSDIRNRWHVVGGGTLRRNDAGFANLREVEDHDAVIYAGYSPVDMWGSQNGLRRVAARFTVNNELVNAHVDALMYFVLQFGYGGDAPPIAVAGGYSIVDSIESGVWGDRKAPNDLFIGSTCIWPPNGDYKTYKNGNCRAHITARAWPA